MYRHAVPLTLTLVVALPLLALAAVLVETALGGPPAAAPLARPEVAAPPVAEPVVQAPPFADAAPVSAQTARLARVESRLRAGSYSYLEVRFADTGASAWLAVLGEGVDRGAEVRATVFAEKAPFTSRRLERDFERVLFATIEPAASDAQSSL